MRLYEAAIAYRAYTAFGGEFDDSFRQFVARLVVRCASNGTIAVRP